MNIKLAENWYIKSDSINVILLEKINERDYVQGYYSSLQGCIEAYINKKINRSEATSIHSLLIYLKQLVTSLNEALTPLQIEVVMPETAKNEENEK